jgi:NADH:ubiquinone oxidoreductase subunit 6 (subunit J)
MELWRQYEYPFHVIAICLSLALVAAVTMFH